MIIKTTQEKMRELASDWIEYSEPMIIELGCSNGNFANLLNNKGIINYTGIDILSEKIKEARNRFPHLNFIDCDITTNLYLLKSATTFVSFQCLEHIEDDLNVISAIPLGAIVIISVPNSPYKKEHKRWFEIEGWIKRFSPFININETVTIQNITKEKKRSFLFRGLRR